MTSSDGKSIHGSAVLVGDRAVVIRGPSGSGKSRLAFDLIVAAGAGQISEAILVGDDRLYLEARHNQLFVRPAPQLEGLIEIRGLGIRRCDFRPEAIVGLVVDLSADDAERHPKAEALVTEINGVKLPRVPVGTGFAALPVVMGALMTTPASRV
jgi:HPr kinase/phosphorylase